jgi:uncharacterized OB-fold protein
MDSNKPLPRITPDTQAFWDGCAAGELRVQRCTACDARQFPPRGRCGECSGTEFEWTSNDLRGEIYSFTVVHRAPIQAFRADCPYVLALVDVAPGARLMLNVTGCDPDAVYIGMQVAIEFDDRPDAVVPIARAL